MRPLLIRQVARVSQSIANDPACISLGSRSSTWRPRISPPSMESQPIHGTQQLSGQTLNTAGVGIYIRLGQKTFHSLGAVGVSLTHKITVHQKLELQFHVCDGGKYPNIIHVSPNTPTPTQKQYVGIIPVFSSLLVGRPQPQFFLCADDGTVPMNLNNGSLVMDTGPKPMQHLADVNPVTHRVHMCEFELAELSVRWPEVEALEKAMVDKFVSEIRLN